MPSPSDVETELATARQRIAAAIADANKQIDRMNSLVSTAYGYAAQASAANHCGTASSSPSPLRHIV